MYLNHNIFKDSEQEHNNLNNLILQKMNGEEIIDLL